MFGLLYKYLLLNKEVSLPGIGVFILERKPAKLDFANKVFVSPTFQIVFRSQAPINDNRIHSFISREERMKESEASNRYDAFAQSIREKLSANKTVELPGLGVLSENEEGGIHFKETTTLDDYFPKVSADRVIRENTEHHVLVGEIKRTNKEMKEVLVEGTHLSSGEKDYWWISAIALAIIGIATIVYYYLHNGSLH